MLTEWASWRWVMFVNVPIGLAVLAVGRAVLSETPRRRGRFDLAGGAGIDGGMTGVVLGLVQAGTSGWGAPITVGVAGRRGGPAGAVRPHRVHRRGAHPAPAHSGQPDPGGRQRRPGPGLRRHVRHGLLPHPVPPGDPAPLGPGTGLGFLPTPISVFLASQFTSRVLAGRVPAKTLMLVRIGALRHGTAARHPVARQHALPQTLVTLVLIGAGMGISFVSLTTAGLAGVALRTPVRLQDSST